MTTFPKTPSNPEQAAGNAIKSAKKYVDLASKGASRLKTYSDAAKKLRDESKELSTLQSLAADLKYVSEISTALEVASAGFAALSALLPVPTIEDKILDQVRQNFGAIEALSKDLETDFTHLTNGQKITAQISSLNDGTRPLRTGRGALRTLEKHPGNEAALADLDAVTLGQLDDAMTAMVDAAQGNLLQLLHDDTYGELAQLEPVLSTLTEGVELFIMLRARAQANKDGATDDAARAKAAHSVGEDFHDRIATIDKTVAHWVDVCTDTKESRRQIERYITTELAGHFASKDRQAITDLIVELVTAKYPYLAVSALVTAHRAGFDWHCFRYPAHQSFSKLGQPVKNDTPIDLYVTWRPRYPGLHAPQRPSNRNSIEQTASKKRSDTEKSLQMAGTLVNVYYKKGQFFTDENGKKFGMVTRTDSRMARNIFFQTLRLSLMAKGISANHADSYCYVCCYVPAGDSIGFTSGTHCAYSTGPRIYSPNPENYGRYWQFAFWL